MSTKYPGGIISKTAPTPSGPYSTDTAPGVWTLEQQAYWQKLGQWPTAGNVNPNAFIENLFSTYLYTGTGAAQTITNGIDLSTNGGMVWQKSRSGGPFSGVGDHVVTDTARGNTKTIYPNTTGGQDTITDNITAFNTTGFTLGTGAALSTNDSGTKYVGWTFRKQAKFFDVVTYTGTGSVQNISHNLGAVPGFMLVKGTNPALGAQNWNVYHTSIGSGNRLILNDITGTVAAATTWNSTDPTSTQFTVGTSSQINYSGSSYVAYLFANNAGGFGLSGSENVITCGTFTTGTNRNFSVTLGYEPQWLLVKRTDSAENWQLVDVMRGFSMTGDALLNPNLSDAETNNTSPYLVNPTATGFEQTGSSGAFNGTYIYIAIRRGPMATPTVGTSVFNPVTYTGTGSASTQVVTTFAPDMAWPKNRGGSDSYAWTRLQGLSGLVMSDASAEAALTNRLTSWNQTGITLGTAQPNNSGDSYVLEGFKRAPGFFDVVCYTGGSGAQTVPHNLGVAPELMIIKSRSLAGTTPGWPVYTASGGVTKYLSLDTTDGETTFAPFWGGTAPTSTNFYLGGYAATNNTGDTYVAYLFATCPGVSKVGSYTGTGATQTINCGFTGGARFVVIKRTDLSGVGGWYVWDTARGMVSGTDPFMSLNSGAAEVNTNSIYSTASGFQIVITSAGINASGGSYIFLAIA